MEAVNTPMELCILAITHSYRVWGQYDRGDSFGNNTRRSFIKEGALATIGLRLTGTSLSSGFRYRQDDDLFVENEAMEGIMNRFQFRPGGVFVIISPSIDESPPNIEGILENGLVETLRL